MVKDDPSVVLTNKSVVKAAQLLSELALHPEGTSASTVASRTGLSRPTVVRLLYTLEQCGLLDRTDTSYFLGWELARLGRLADPYSGLIARMKPALEALAESAREWVGLSVPTPDSELDLVAEASGSYVIGTGARYLGQRYPLHASSAGKILLAEFDAKALDTFMDKGLAKFTPRTITTRSALRAELAKIREQDYAIVDNELELGHLSYSVPVRNPKRTLIAVLTLQGPKYRLEQLDTHDTIAEMKAVAKESEHMLVPPTDA